MIAENDTGKHSQVRFISAAQCLQNEGLDANSFTFVDGHNISAAQSCVNVQLAFTETFDMPEKLLFLKNVL